MESAADLLPTALRYAAPTQQDQGDHPGNEETLGQDHPPTGHWPRPPRNGWGAWGRTPGGAPDADRPVGHVCSYDGQEQVTSGDIPRLGQCPSLRDAQGDSLPRDPSPVYGPLGQGDLDELRKLIVAPQGKSASPAAGVAPAPVASGAAQGARELDFQGFALCKPGLPNSDPVRDVRSPRAVARCRDATKDMGH